MDVWEVIGWEKVAKQNDPTKYNVRLYCMRNLKEGAQGDGVECGRLYFNPEYVKYEPAIGQKIIATEGRYGIDRIYVVA